MTSEFEFGQVLRRSEERINDIPAEALLRVMVIAIGNRLDGAYLVLGLVGEKGTYTRQRVDMAIADYWVIDE